MRRLIKQTIFSVCLQQNVVVDDGHWCYPKDLQGLSQGRFCSATTKSKGTPATFNFEVRVAVFQISVDMKRHNFRLTPALTVWSVGALISMVIFTIEQFLNREGKFRRQPGQNASRHNHEDTVHGNRHNATSAVIGSV